MSRSPRGCGDLDALLAAVAVERPDVLLTDIRMPPDSSDEGILARALVLRETHPDLGVVVLSQYSDPAYALALLEAGSDGRACICSRIALTTANQLVGASPAVAAGGSYIDPKVVERLVAAKSAAERSPLAELTPRELDVLREMAQGANNAGIAAALVVAERRSRSTCSRSSPSSAITWESNVTAASRRCCSTRS